LPFGRASPRPPSRSTSRSRTSWSTSSRHSSTSASRCPAWLRSSTPSSCWPGV